MNSGRAAIIVGAGGHAVSVAETVSAAGYAIAAFTSDRHPRGELLGRPVLADVPEEHIERDGIVVVAIGDNFSRERAWNDIVQRVPLDQLPAVVHPSASVSVFASLAAGCVVMQGAVVASGATLGTGCLLNTASVLDHEGATGEFASLAPRAVTGGRVTIGQRTAISIGAVIRHGVTVGSDTVIGAASYVHADVPANVVAYGVPARVIRPRNANDSYLG